MIAELLRQYLLAAIKRHIYWDMYGPACMWTVPTFRLKLHRARHQLDGEAYDA